MVGGVYGRWCIWVVCNTSSLSTSLHTPPPHHQTQVQQGITGHLGHVHPNSIIGPASLLLVLLHYLSSPWLRPHCITHHLLQQLATLLDGLVNGLVNGQRSTLAVESASQALEVLLHVVEALFQQPDVLQRWFGVALTQLLPALALCTSQLWDGQLWDDHGATPQHPHMPAKAAGIVRNEEGVMAAKLLCDLLLVLLWEPRCCNYAIQQDGEGDHHGGDAFGMLCVDCFADAVCLLYAVYAVCLYMGYICFL